MFGVGLIHVCMTHITYMQSHELCIKEVIPRMIFTIIYMVVFIWIRLNWYLNFCCLKVNICIYQILCFVMLMCVSDIRIHCFLFLYAALLQKSNFNKLVKQLKWA